MLSLYDCTTVQCMEKTTHVSPFPFFFISIFPNLYHISASGVHKVLVYVCMCVLVCACVYMIHFIPYFTYKTANSSSWASHSINMSTPILHIHCQGYSFCTWCHKTADCNSYYSHRVIENAWIKTALARYISAINRLPPMPKTEA